MEACKISQVLTTVKIHIVAFSVMEKKYIIWWWRYQRFEGTGCTFLR